jgi:hypothetical protein
MTSWNSLSDKPIADAVVGLSMIAMPAALGGKSNWRTAPLAVMRSTGPPASGTVKLMPSCWSAPPEPPSPLAPPVSLLPPVPLEPLTALSPPVPDELPAPSSETPSEALLEQPDAAIRIATRARDGRARRVFIRVHSTQQKVTTRGTAGMACAPIPPEPRVARTSAREHGRLVAGALAASRALRGSETKVATLKRPPLPQMKSDNLERIRGGRRARTSRLA